MNCVEESEDVKRSDDREHTETLGLAQGYLGREEMGRPRLEYFDQIIRDMGCETFREVKGLAWDRVKWRRGVMSNQSQDCVLNDDEINE